MARQIEQGDQFRRHRTNRAGKACAIAQTFRRHHRRLRRQRGVCGRGNQRFGIGEHRLIRAAQLHAMQIGEKNPVFRRRTNLRIAFLQGNNLRTQRRITNAHNAVTLPVHPRRRLSRRIEHGLHLRLGQHFAGDKMAKRAVLLQYL